MSLSRQEAYSVHYDPSGLLVAKNEDLSYLAAHIHTKVSDGNMQPEKAVDLAVEAGVTALAVTDHDAIIGSERARNYARNEGLEGSIQVLTGSEVSSKDGHVLALGIDGEVRAGNAIEHTLAEIHAMGGVAIIPHMDFPHIKSVSSETTQHLLLNPRETRPDGLEVFNASTVALQQVPLLGRMFREGTNTEVTAFHKRNKSLSGAAFGGVDAHGRNMTQVLTGYEGNDPLAAIREERTAVVFDASAFRGSKNREEVAFLFVGVAQNNLQRFTR